MISQKKIKIFYFTLMVLSAVAVTIGVYNEINIEFAFIILIIGQIPNLLGNKIKNRRTVSLISQNISFIAIIFYYIVNIYNIG